MDGTVRFIHIGAAHRRPLHAVDTAVAVAGMGLRGDRNFGSTRNITIVCDGELRLAAQELGIDAIAPGGTRRNITVTLDELPRRHGTRVHLGEVIVEIWRDATPCEVMDAEIGPGARQALEDRAGVSATVTRGGIIRVGDPVVIDPE
jgi:MOSC domain-containing protein YiiM